MTWFTQTELLTLLHYNPLTGELTWKHRPDGPNNWNARYAGKPALTSINDAGYRHGTLMGKTVSAHEIIWTILHGYKAETVDHEDHDRSNNRLINLREASRMQNQQNQGPNANNKSGTMGIWWYAKRGYWKAFINIEGKRKELGCFKNKDAAIKARQDAEKLYGYHPNHGR